MSSTITFQTIREDLLPNVQVISSFELIGGEKRTLALQILNRYNNQVYLLPSTGLQVMLTLQTPDIATPINLESIPDSTNRSIITNELSVADTKSIISGRLKLTLINVNDAAAGIIVASFAPSAYTATTGKLIILDAVDLSTVIAGDFLVDGLGEKFVILDVNNTTGAKTLEIGLNKTVNLTGCVIKRSTDILIAIRDNIFTRVKL